MLVSAGILLLACASSILVFATRDVASTSDSAGRERNLFSTFERDQVKRLELVQNGEKLALERAGDAGGSAQFKLVEPVKENADPATVDKFLSALAAAHALRLVEPAPPPATLGLNKP